MKTLKTKFLLLVVFMLINATYLSAIDPVGVITISGVVKDQQSKKTIENVSVSVLGTNIGTVTNADGVFTIKLSDSLQASNIEFVHIGYSNKRIPIEHNVSGIVVSLSPNAIVLNEASILSGNAAKLVEEALRRVGENYSDRPNLLTGFYRETVQKRRTYIGVSEAIIDIYKRPYNEEMGIDRERVQINKGRRLISQKASDTIAVKLQGGPNNSIYFDFVKNPDLILNLNMLSEYHFKITGNVMINEREHYAVDFTPAVIRPIPLYKGTLYIDKATLCFSRAEFSMDMKDEDKATQAILQKKPRGLRFSPEEVSFLVSYREQDGKSYISYVRNNLKFKCDWKRKLFRTNYAVVSEMVVIDGKKENVTAIPYRQSFHSYQAFSDKVSDFLDADFWQNYNIIEPTESLELAVNKLRKQREK